MENFMNDISFVKNIDSLGRIVIPMDIRRKLDISTGDSISISVNDKDILLTKYSSLEGNIKIVNIIKSFIEEFDIKVIYMNKEIVIYSNVVTCGTKLDNEVKDMVKNGVNFKGELREFNFGDINLKGNYNMLPLVGDEGIIGSIIVFSDNNGFDFCKLLNKIISLEVSIS
jgi:AbrB family looped-hinge helix DNA binding protein